MFIPVPQISDSLVAGLTYACDSSVDSVSFMRAVMVSMRPCGDQHHAIYKAKKGSYLPLERCFEMRSQISTTDFVPLHVAFAHLLEEATRWICLPMGKKKRKI